MPILPLKVKQAQTLSELVKEKFSPKIKIYLWGYKCRNGHLHCRNSTHWSLSLLSLSGNYETANNAGCPISSTAIIVQANKQTEATFFEEELQVEFPLITLYPNPASAEVYLQAPDPSVQIMAVALDDYNGRSIKTFFMGQNLTYEGNERYSLNISDLPDGLSILTVSTKSSGEFKLRLIKKDWCMSWTLLSKVVF